MARNNGLALLLLGGLAYFLLGRKREKELIPWHIRTRVFDPRPKFTQWAIKTITETERYTPPPPTVTYPEQRAVLLLRKEEIGLRARSIRVGRRTKPQEKGIQYGRGEPAYTPEKEPATYQEQRALRLLDRV